MADNLEVQATVIVDIREAGASEADLKQRADLTPTAKEQAFNLFALASGAEGSYTEVQIGNISTGKLLYLESDQTITVRLNGSIVLADVTFLLLEATSITQVEVDNHSGEEAVIKAAVVGD